MLTITKEIKLYDKPCLSGVAHETYTDSRVVTVRLFGLRIYRYRTTVDRPYSEFWRTHHQDARQHTTNSQKKGTGL